VERILDPSRCRIEKPRPYRAIHQMLRSVRAKRVFDPSLHADENNCASAGVWTEHARYTCSKFHFCKTRRSGRRPCTGQLGLNTTRRRQQARVGTASGSLSRLITSRMLVRLSRQLVILPRPIGQTPRAGPEANGLSLLPAYE
jgi:hypothetical protein